MSDRRNAYRYTGAPEIRMPTTPSGGTSLMDIISGSTPRQLQKQQLDFQSREGAAGRQHEKDINDILNKHEIEMQKLQTQLAKELAGTQYAIEQARQHGVTPEDWSNHVSKIALQKATADLNNQVASMGTDEVKQATTRGEAAKKLAPTVPLTEASKSSVPMGGAGVLKNFANPGQSLDATPDFLRGSTPFQNVSLAPTMMDPNTNKPMMFSPVTTQGNVPASFTPGGSGPLAPRTFPIDPSIRASMPGTQENLLGTGAGSSMAPIPADKQPSNGGGVSTPRMPVTPDAGQQMMPPSNNTLQNAMTNMLPPTMNPTNLPTKGQVADPNFITQWLMNMLRSSQTMGQ